MAEEGVKIADLVSAGTLDGTESLYAVKASADVKTTTADIIALAKASTVANDSSVTGTTVKDALQNLVVKVTGKGLSTNDFDNTEKGKVDSALQTETDPIFVASPAHGIASGDITTWNGKQNALTIGNVTSITSGVTIGNGVGAVIGSGVSINIAIAGASTGGLLTSGHWNEFNAKQAALGFTPENSASKDASGGYVGLTGFILNIWNAAKTFKTGLRGTATQTRAIDLPDDDGTIALDKNVLKLDQTTPQTVGLTGSRLAKLWATDLDIANEITGKINKATNLVGGNSTTLKGSIPYQSDTDTTLLLAPNITTTKKFLRSTGDATNGTAPAWDTIADGDIANSIVIGKLITGFVSGAGTVAATDSILQTINKLDGNIALKAPITSPTFLTNITAPLIIGGTAVGSNIIYKSTTGAGTLTGIAHQWTGGTNGGTALATMLNNGNVGIGTTNPISRLSNTDAITGDDIYIPSVYGLNWKIARDGEYAAVFENAEVNGYGDGVLIKAGGDKYSGRILLNIANNDNTSRFIVKGKGNVGIGINFPTAVLHLKAGSDVANGAPLKLNSGALTTGANITAGSVEFLTDAFYGTITTGTVRRMFVMSQTGRATAQTAANASVQTFTLPATDGSYQICSNVKVSTSSAEAFTVTVAYTDEDNTSRTATMNFQLVNGTIGTAIAFANGTVPYMGIPLNIRCKASTAITVATTGTFTGCTYNVETFFKKVA